ncbi:MAG TPA: glycosyl hydrolase [Mycobacteriales bacterium]|nr:glycosyl hydrolase [Mycobacteriales bacterium]
MFSRRTSTATARASVVLVIGVLTTLIAFLLPTAAGASTLPANACTLSSLDVPSCGILWGAYTPPASGQTLTTAVTDLESQVGRTFDIVYHYHDFSGPATAISGTMPDSYEKALAASGHIIFEDWASRIYSTNQQIQWSAIADGDYDSSVIIPEAQSIKAFGQPIMLTFDSEMDSRVGTSGTAADYVAAYRHIHDVFAAQGVTNVIWVWTPTGYTGHESLFNSLYPGNSYVDWIGYDPYNFYNCQSASGAWKTPQQTIDPMYQWLEANGYGDKPFILPEYGTVPNPSDSTAAAYWYGQLTAAITAHPNIKGMLEWDDSSGNCDTYLTQPGELAAFAQVGLSSAVLGTPPPAAPTAPTVTSTSPTAATVSWTGVQGATAYQVQRSVSGANAFSNVGEPVTGTSYSDTGMTPGSSEDYRVLATNASGSSAPSSSSSITLLPGQPGTLTAATNGASEVDLRWGAATGATSYDIRKGAVGAGTFPTDLGTASGTSFADTGLTPGASADYEVVPVDSAGDGVPSGPATGTTLPAQVTGLSATAVSPGEVDLSWSAASGAAAYSVERSPAGAGSWSVLAANASATSYRDTSVSQLTSYDYRVAAVGAAGQGAFSATQTVTTPQVAPGQVTGLTAAPASSTQVNLAWNAMANASSYEVERSSTSAASGFSPLAMSVTAPSYSDVSAAPGTTYWYEVLARNSGGMGTASAVATAATPYAALLANGFEGQANGTAITTQNSGGAAGNAFNQDKCTAGSVTYSTVSAAHGRDSALLSPATGLCYLGWNSTSITPATSVYGRAYVKFSADPKVSVPIMRLTDAASNRDAQVNLTSAGYLSIVTATGMSLPRLTQPLPLNQWVRLEWHLSSAASGTFELRMYAGDATTPIETQVETGINTGTSVAGTTVGALGSSASGLGTTIGLDDLAYGTAGWLGPVIS